MSKKLTESLLFSLVAGILAIQVVTAAEQDSTVQAQCQAEAKEAGISNPAELADYVKDCIDSQKPASEGSNKDG
jgi:hypothetical protein